VPDVISRRELLLAAVSVALLPAKGVANSIQDNNADHKALSWSEFQVQMTTLAAAEANGSIDQKVVAERGLQFLQGLDIQSAEFMAAVDASFESGNSFWLWQRMMKDRNVNGGILNIDSDHIVQLHDHPGATGMVRIISGEAEAWQFDERSARKDIAELRRVSRSILGPGDTAVLAPGKGNIHALRSVSRECRMLDFFIPPYVKSERSWFEPLAENWFDKENITCRKIPQHAYTKA
jgi:hypothetical protein